MEDEDMKEISLAELKIIQMDILSAVHRFCTEKSIGYSLACGTMLGAARHKGYIPWDDDIDIYMLREDYDRFNKFFPQALDGKYVLTTLERDHKYESAYGKVYDNTTVMQESKPKPYEMGVNIDVFPIDRVPENGKEWQRYNAARLGWINRWAMKSNGYTIFNWHKERSILSNTIMTAGKIAMLFVSVRQTAKWLQRFARKYDHTDSPLVFECCMGIFQKHPFPRSLFDNLSLIEFEDRQYLAFTDYDTYLTNGFGDWRQLPPKEEQVSHHEFHAFYKT